MRSVALASVVLLGGCHPGLADCEDAIKARLKAPATYKRVALQPGDFRYEVDFDADNAFGTPIRDHATCTLSSDGLASIELRSDQERADKELNEDLQRQRSEFGLPAL